MVLERGIIEVNRNVVLIWGRNEAEKMVRIMTHINAEFVSGINFQIYCSRKSKQ